MTEKSKIGRPALPDADKRSATSMVRLTADEVHELDVARGGVPLARFIREAALEKARQK